MARTGVCVPLEQHTGLEPAQAAWKAAVLPLHKCCISPPLAESGTYHALMLPHKETCTVIPELTGEALDEHPGIEPA